MRQRVPALAAVLITVMLIVGCGPRQEADSGVLIRIVSSDSAVQLANDLTRSFSDKQSMIEFDINSHPCQNCQRMVVEGDVHLALAPLSPSDVPADMSLTPVARSGIAVIVHPSNSIDSLTLLELRDLYMGTAGEWQSLGESTGPPVQVLSQETECPVAGQFEAVVLADGRVTPNALVLPNEEAILGYVSEHPGAIGYVSAAAVDDRVETVAVEGMRPDPETVADGTYHIVLDLYAINRVPAAPEVAEFIQFITSPSGQSVVGRHYGKLR